MREQLLVVLSHGKGNRGDKTDQQTWKPCAAEARNYGRVL